MIRRTFKTGDRFTFSDEGKQNECYAKYLNGTYTVARVYSHHVSASEMANDPTGHPGFDPGAGSALYEADGLPFALYDWEMTRV